MEKTKKRLTGWQKSVIILSVVAFLFAAYAIVMTVVAFKSPVNTISKAEFISQVGGIENVSIPIVEVKTKGGQEPYNKEDYVECSVSISNCDNQLAVDMGEAGIRLRGNTTMAAEKKPYRIKFNEKQNVLGSAEANKSWVLLADYLDQSKVRNYTALSLGQYFDNLTFTPSPNHVVLFMNDRFQGLYLLTDQVDENSGRADVKNKNMTASDTDFSFLVEMDHNALLEGVTGVDNFQIEGYEPIEIKYPESDERPMGENGEDIVFDYIKEYMNAVLTTLRTGSTVSVSFRDVPVGFEDLVDVDSMIDYYLINEIMLNRDSEWKSIYFHKGSKATDKLQFGPVWDFDWSMSEEWIVPYTQCEIDSAKNIVIAKNSAIFKKVFRYQKYYDLMVQRFNEKKDAILAVSDELREHRLLIDNVALLDAKCWYGQDGVFEYGMQYDYVRLFLQDRHYYINQIFAKPHSEFLKLI